MDSRSLQEVCRVSDTNVVERDLLGLDEVERVQSRESFVTAMETSGSTGKNIDVRFSKSSIRSDLALSMPALKASVSLITLPNNASVISVQFLPELSIAPQRSFVTANDTISFVVSDREQDLLNRPLQNIGTESARINTSMVNLVDLVNHIGRGRRLTYATSPTSKTKLIETIFEKPMKTTSEMNREKSLLQYNTSFSDIKEFIQKSFSNNVEAEPNTVSPSPSLDVEDIMVVMTNSDKPEEGQVETDNVSTNIEAKSSIKGSETSNYYPCVSKAKLPHIMESNHNRNHLEEGSAITVTINDFNVSLSKTSHTDGCADKDDGSLIGIKLNGNDVSPSQTSCIHETNSRQDVSDNILTENPRLSSTYESLVRLGHVYHKLKDGKGLDHLFDDQHDIHEVPEVKTSDVTCSQSVTELKSNHHDEEIDESLVSITLNGRDVSSSKTSCVHETKSKQNLSDDNPRLCTNYDSLVRLGNLSETLKDGKGMDSLFDQNDVQWVPEIKTSDISTAKSGTELENNPEVQAKQLEVLYTDSEEDLKKFLLTFKSFYQKFGHHLTSTIKDYQPLMDKFEELPIPGENCDLTRDVTLLSPINEKDELNLLKRLAGDQEIELNEEVDLEAAVSKMIVEKMSRLSVDQSLQLLTSFTCLFPKKSTSELQTRINKLLENRNENLQCSGKDLPKEVLNIIQTSDNPHEAMMLFTLFLQLFESFRDQGPSQLSFFSNKILHTEEETTSGKLNHDLLVSLIKLFHHFNEGEKVEMEIEGSNTSKCSIVPSEKRSEVEETIKRQNQVSQSSLVRWYENADSTDTESISSEPSVQSDSDVHKELRRCPSDIDPKYLRGALDQIIEDYLKNNMESGASESALTTLTTSASESIYSADHSKSFFAVISEHDIESKPSGNVDVPAGNFVSAVSLKSILSEDASQIDTVAKLDELRMNVMPYEAAVETTVRKHVEQFMVEEDPLSIKSENVQPIESFRKMATNFEPSVEDSIGKTMHEADMHTSPKDDPESPTPTIDEKEMPIMTNKAAEGVVEAEVAENVEEIVVKPELYKSDEVHASVQILEIKSETRTNASIENGSHEADMRKTPFRHNTESPTVEPFNKTDTNATHNIKIIEPVSRERVNETDVKHEPSKDALQVRAIESKRTIDTNKTSMESLLGKSSRETALETSSSGNTVTTTSNESSGKIDSVGSKQKYATISLPVSPGQYDTIDTNNKKEKSKKKSLKKKISNVFKPVKKSISSFFGIGKSKKKNSKKGFQQSRDEAFNVENVRIEPDIIDPMETVHEVVKTFVFLASVKIFLTNMASCLLPCFCKPVVN